MMIHIINIIILIEFVGNGISNIDNRSNDISDTSTRSNSTELVSDRKNTIIINGHTVILLEFVVLLVKYYQQK